MWNKKIGVLVYISTSMKVFNTIFVEILENWGNHDVLNGRWFLDTCFGHTKIIGYRIEVVITRIFLNNINLNQSDSPDPLGGWVYKNA